LSAARFVDEIGSPWVGWHLDLGNLIAYGWPEQWAHILGPRVFNLHIKEYSRKKADSEGPYKGFQVELGEGDNDWHATMAALDAIDHKGWGILEVRGGDAERLKFLAEGPALLLQHACTPFLGLNSALAIQYRLIHVKHSMPNLDGLRAFAILPVLAMHGGFPTGGFLGVDLFFVLSGFLITGLLFRELQETATINFRCFYARRALRLFPAAIASLALAYGFFYYTGDSKNFPIAALSVIFYFSNFIGARLLGPLSSAWSLAIEEQFYLLWPVALLGLFSLFRGRRRPLMYCMLGAVLIVALIRASMYHYCPRALDLYRFTFSRADSLMAGAIAALIISRHRFTSLPILSVAVAVIVSSFVIAVFLCSSLSPVMYYGGFTFAAFVFAALVIALSQMPPLLLFSHPLMVWIGRRSYGLYIYHLTIFEALQVVRVPGSKLNLIWVSLLRFGLSFLVAALSYRFLEKPFLNLKEKFVAPRSPAPTEVSPSLSVPDATNVA
jgi:peptidoglycan/LPS O-acetylase OafA/YrhL